MLGDLPLVYPFIVNDPGEGTQAKRRGHATVVDHLVPPMARADTYGDMAKLEQLLDEYATVAALDPAKLPALRAQIWTLVQAAQLHHDLHVDATRRPTDEFDDFVLHIDGYLCEIKDVQIRDGLHILGRRAGRRGAGEPACWRCCAPRRSGAARPGRCPACARRWRRASGLDEQALLAEPGGLALTAPAAAGAALGRRRSRRAPASDVVDVLEQLARRLVTDAGRGGLGPRRPTLRSATRCSARRCPTSSPCCEFAATEVVPRLARTTDEIANVLRALDGGYVPPGPSGSPTRGLVNVLPTGRNFYSVDPKAIPSRNAWDVGRALADSLLARHLADTGEYPRSRRAHRLGHHRRCAPRATTSPRCCALLGCRPVWDEASRRVTGFEVVPARGAGPPAHRRDRAHLRVLPRRVPARHRAASTTRCAAVAELDEPPRTTTCARTPTADAAAHGDRRRATTRIFGSKPGAYGAGLLPLIDARNWRSDADLAEVYAVWGGYAYGRGLDGREARGGHGDARSGASRSRRRTRTPASTTSSTPTTTSSTTAAWSRWCAR